MINADTDAEEAGPVYSSTPKNVAPFISNDCTDLEWTAAFETIAAEEVKLPFEITAVIDTEI